MLYGPVRMNGTQRSAIETAAKYLPNSSICTRADRRQVLISHRDLPHRLVDLLSIESGSFFLRHACRTSTRGDLRLLLSLACLPVIQGGWVFLQQSKMESNRPIKSPVHANTQERTVPMCLIHANGSRYSWNVTVRKLLGSGSRWSRALSRLRLSLLLQMKVAVKQAKWVPKRAPCNTFTRTHEVVDLACYNAEYDKLKETW